ncbi:DNA/RNA polymerase, partial [Saccharata proteae CBS 121410]
LCHQDYDAFYATCFEVENPALRSLPLAVQQKQILVTCNYEARRRGLHKLQLIKEAKQNCPDLIVVLGEDLSRFRAYSKALYSFLRAFSWNNKVERLGFDEVFLDVTDIVEYNVTLINPNDPTGSFFHLSRNDPTRGFPFDASVVAGDTYEPIRAENRPSAQEDLHRRLRVGSHLARFMRTELHGHHGFTATIGISSSKLLAKLVGNLHKPNGQTTLLPPYVGDGDAETNVSTFIDSHDIGKMPGIGFKLAQKLRAFILSRPPAISSGCVHGRTEENVTVKDVRTHPSVTPASLENLLQGPGSPHGIGAKIWNLLHGIDDAEVRPAREVPRQISIEDSYIKLNTIEDVVRELGLLATSLLKRMRLDLLDRDDDDVDSTPTTKTGNNERQPNAAPPPNTPAPTFLARPRTLRLTTRPRPPPLPTGVRPRSFARISRSAPLPAFVFSLTDSIDILAKRLVTEALLPLFRKLHPERDWDLSLVNVCMTNMDVVSGRGRGRGLGDWIRRGSEDFLCPSTQESGLTDLTPVEHGCWDEGDWVEEEEDGDELPRCVVCGAHMPAWAMAAHERFH